MDPLAAYVLFGVLFVCIRPIFTNLCPLFPSWNGIVPNINRALKSADFSANSIGDEGTAALSDALKANSTLETLDLRFNKVGAAGAQSLAGMLQVNRALITLDLSRNNIGGVSWVKKDQMQGTSFNKGDIVRYNGQMCMVLKEEESSWPHDGELKVQDISGVAALAEALEVNRSLISVDLRFNSIPDDGCRQLRAAVGNKSITLQLEQ